jgi:hypothetical protein
MLGYQEVRYEAELEEAIQRTSQWGLACPAMSFNTQRYLTNDFIGQIVKSAQRVTRHLRPSDIVGQCFAVHHFIKDAIEDDLGVPLLYTIGYVSFGSEAVFHTNLDELKSMLHRGRISGPLRLHAWLTMPTHEILDLTFGTTYGVVNGVKEVIGNATFLHPGELKGTQRYRPQLVGTDYLHRIGAFAVLPNFV